MNNKAFFKYWNKIIVIVNLRSEDPNVFLLSHHIFNLWFYINLTRRFRIFIIGVNYDYCSEKIMVGFNSTSTHLAVKSHEPTFIIEYIILIINPVFRPNLVHIPMR